VFRVLEAKLVDGREFLLQTLEGRWFLTKSVGGRQTKKEIKKIIFRI